MSYGYRTAIFYILHISEWLPPFSASVAVFFVLRAEMLMAHYHKLIPLLLSVFKRMRVAHFIF